MRNEAPKFRSIRCDHIDTLVEAQERGEIVEVEHVCENPLRHAGPLDDLIDSLVGDPADGEVERAIWERAVADGEPWAIDTEDDITRKPCPTCSGPIRETVGMVCQTCGTDYGSGAL